MADNYSEQAATIATEDPGNWSPLAANVAGGRVRRAYFNFDEATHGTGGSASLGETVYLCKIPANARVFDGWIAHEAFVTGTGGVDLDIGIEGYDGSGYYTGTTADDVDFFSTAASLVIDAAGAVPFNDKITDAGFGYLTTKDVWVTATLIDGGAGAVMPGAAFKGWINYVSD